MERIKKRSKRNCDLVLVFIILILLMFGFLMVYSSSYPDGFYNYGDSIYFLKKQLLAGIAGIFVMVIASYVPYKVYRRFTKVMVLLSIGLSLITLLLGVSGNGAQRWLKFAGISIQPSEIIKLFAVMCMADYFDKRRKKLKRLVDGYLYTLLATFGFVGLIVVQQDLSTSIVLALVLIIMFFCAGAKISHLLVTGFISLGGIVLLILKYSYRMVRIVVFLDPFKYYREEGWQLIQSLYALGTGGLFGLGLGKSRQKFFYLPEAYNDFIFSIIAEEFGFFGCIVLIITFILFAWRGMRIAMNAEDFYGGLVAVGLTSLVLIQFLVHVAVATSSIPPTGRALPFISAGGTSILLLLASMGILLNISKGADIYEN